MNRPRRLLLLSLALTAVVAACASAGSSASPPAAGSTPLAAGSTPLAPSPGGTASETQRSEGGQVTVEATWTGPKAGAVFDIKLDTHSVDLDALDLSNTVLRNDRGQTLTSEPWTAPRGGHHREGTLTFAGDPTSFFAGARSIEIVFTKIGDVPERTLRWEIGL